MPRQIICFLVTCLLLCSFTLTADESTITTSVNELPITLQGLLESNGRDNVVNLFQQGSFNQASISQIGIANNAYLIQQGEDNQASVNQVGSNNELELLQQGNYNRADVTQIGNDNLIQINQLGRANFAIEQIADNAAITITQY
ncbi:curlin [Shewanella sp. SR44-3]|uniref:curlin n=1 Tax=unclassified Shewanella TaxID=196818 RepID=UPI0015F86C04|nr:curlin [Shewanella sp. SR44-3]MBB1269685.1 curlin [Shewanella sp. SR44-3]